MGYKHYGVNTGGIPVDYIKRFVDAHGIEIFIETGTAGGESVRAVAPFFKECHTIEIVEQRADTLVYPDNVALHTGDSANLLKDIADMFKGQKIFFWLDAHWSEPHESQEWVKECPILEEIEAIRGHNAIIMIDDARLFYGAPPWPCNPEKWPRFMHVMDKLRGCFPSHITTVVDDYIICFPSYMRDTHRDEWRQRYLERYPSDDTRLKDCVRNSYYALKHYIE